MMSLRLGSLMVGCAAALTATLFAGRDARACGGCFHPVEEPEPTVIRHSLDCNCASQSGRLSGP